MVCVGTLGLFSKGKIEPSSVVCVCGRGGGRGGEGWEPLNGMALIITNSVLGMYRYTITVLLTLIVCSYCLLSINGCYLIPSESPIELSRAIARLQ